MHWCGASVLAATLSCAMSLLAATPPPQQPTVDSLVRDLGDNSFAVRERASDQLRRMGDAAIPALKKALDSTDAEVRWRAKNLLAELNLGITSDWPPELADLARSYETLPPRQQTQALNRLATVLQDKALAFVLYRISEGSDHEIQPALQALRSMTPQSVVVPRVIAALKDPKTPAERRALSWAFASDGKILDALRAVSGLQPPHNAPHELIEKALHTLQAQLNGRKYEEAADIARQFAEAAPADTRFLYAQAAALEKLGQSTKAEELVVHALSLNASDESRHFTTAEWLRKIGRDDFAAREYEKILKLDPDDSVYDCNAYFRLSDISLAAENFADAADWMQKGLDAFRRAAASSGGFGLVGPAEKDIEAQIRRLRQQAARAAAVNADPDGPLDSDDLNLTVGIALKDARAADMRRAVASTVGAITLHVQPRGLRLLDEPSATMRYDPKKGEIAMFLNNQPASHPAPIELKGEKARLTVNLLDICYIFEFDAATGQARRVARFERDYIVTLVPSERLRALNNVTLILNGKKYDWKEALNGVRFDILPEKLEIAIEGTNAAGKKLELKTASVLDESRVNQLEPRDHEDQR
jgi:Flp pilus assembly protein TadD